MNNNKLAENIATEILTIWKGPECTRVQLMLEQPDGSERNMGGRNKDCLITTIEEVLRKERG
jgi:hypothetical protein